MKRRLPYEDCAERLSGYKRRVPIGRYLLNKRHCHTEEMTKRFRYTDLLQSEAVGHLRRVEEEEIPYLVISEMPITKAERSPECFYFMFREWGIDVRIWAATDIQRIYRGWSVRRQQQQQRQTGYGYWGAADERLNVIIPLVGLHPGTFIK